MYLEMKTRCERCGAVLLPEGEAYICSYECSFCAECAASMFGTCAHCGGELIRRPRRTLLSSAGGSGDFTKPVRRRPWLIWVISFGLWMFIALAGGLSMYQFDRSLGRPMTLTQELMPPFVNYLIFAVLTPFVFALGRRYPIQRGNWARRTGLYLATGVLFLLLHVTVRGLAYPVWDPRLGGYVYPVWNPHTGAWNFQGVVFKKLLLYDWVDDIFSAYLPILLIAHAVTYYRNFREREFRSSQLETQLAKANLQALKSQLQPHFLFNTMHSISALMLSDVQAADRMMTRLSDLLRMSLENDGVQITSLSREIEFVNGYLEIEKIRFEERLRVTVEVSPDALDAQVPQFLLQPLVENAVKHGISHQSAGGEIRIAASHDERHLYLQVRDNGPGLADSGAKAGLGLRATRERLQALYGSDQSIEVVPASAGGAEVRVRIPFRTEARPL